MNRKILKYIKNPMKIISYLINKGCFKWLNDYLVIRIKYKLSFNQKINLKNPKSFNEKLQWLKLHDRKDIYTTMVDKYEVKRYVSNIIGEEYLIPTIGIYNSFEDISFDDLPNQFVIKCTHDSGGLVIVKDKSKLDIENIKRRIKKCLKRNYYYSGREWPYKNVKPRIIIEKYMENDVDKELKDYKFWCFNGKVEMCLVCTNRQTKLKETFFDNNWNLLELKRPNHDIDLSVTKPINFELMKLLAEKLSKDLSFIRVDFYEVSGKVYFGELTFYPASGFDKFEPEEWDHKLGEMIDLSLVKKDEK